MEGINKVVYPGYGGKSDVRMCLNDYYELVDGLRQDDLTNKGIMKFKNLYMANMFNGLAVLTVSTIPAMLLSKWVIYPVYKSHADYKILTPIFLTAYVLSARALSYKPVPRRLYTEILTDEGSDGDYIRSTLRNDKANLWKYLSGQLYDLGYRFPEMLEVNKQEFPTALLN